VKVECKDLERILRDEKPEELAALATHAESCAACREELELWREISVAASGMQRRWESPLLWPAIRRALQQEAHARERRSWWGAIFPAWTPAAGWQMAVAALVLVVLSGVSVVLLRQIGSKTPLDVTIQQVQDRQRDRLLTEQALREVEAAEADYMNKIDRLAQLAQPKLEQPNSALMATYREKLIVLDAAIADLRANAEQNRFNANLRTELLNMYQEKQRTLQAVMSDGKPR
jgi:hypothetical protein